MSSEYTKIVPDASTKGQGAFVQGLQETERALGGFRTPAHHEFPAPTDHAHAQRLLDAPQVTVERPAQVRQAGVAGRLELVSEGHRGGRIAHGMAFRAARCGIRTGKRPGVITNGQPGSM